ncbi:MAG: hypothetical protein WD226_07315 [Planctomycetota bacterium]
MSQQSSPSPAKKPFRRRRKWIKPRLQLRLIGTFIGLSALGFVLQAQLMTAELVKHSLDASELGASLNFPGLIWGTLAISFGILLPLTVAVGMLATFRIAGPIYRFEQYLTGVAQGSETGPCKIRAGDELQDLCDRINEAVAALPARAAADAQPARENEQRAA